jgi:hypothetical protein
MMKAASTTETSVNFYQTARPNDPEDSHLYFTCYTGPRAGCCEHGNEQLGSIKGGEFLDYVSVLLTPQKGLCSME